MCKVGNSNRNCDFSGWNSTSIWEDSRMLRFQRVSVFRYTYISFLVLFIKEITALGTMFVYWFWIQHCFSNHGYGWNIWTLTMKLTAGSYVTVYQAQWASSWYKMSFNSSAVFGQIINRTSEVAHWLWWRVVMPLQFVTTRHKMDLILFFWGFSCPNVQCFWIVFGRCPVRITARKQNQFTLVLFNVPRGLQANPKFAHSSGPLALIFVSLRFIVH
jgi:hypothetical protein